MNDEVDEIRGRWLRAWGRKVLAPETYERTLGAAEADLRHELASVPAAEAKRLARSARWMFLRVLIGAIDQDRAEARRGLSWWLLLAPLLAVVVGALGVSLTEGGGLPLAQLVFLVLGLGLGATMAMTPRRILLYEAPLGGWLAVVAVAAVAAFGTATEGASRWLAIGPLMIQMSALALPFVMLALTSLVSRRRDVHALLLAIAAQAAFTATKDAVASLTLGVVAVVVCAVAGGPARRWSWLPMAVVAGAGFAVAGALDPMLAPVAHSEGILGLFTQVSPALTVLGGLALLVAIAAPLMVLRRTADAETRGLALAVALSLAVPAAAATMVATVVPLLGYSGSTVVAAYLGLGALMSLSRRAPAQRKAQPDQAPAEPQASTATTTR